MSKKKTALKPVASTQNLLQDLRELIASTKQEVARTVNSTLVVLYWSVGQRIRQDILKGKRANYGEEILPSVSTELTKEFGSGFAEKKFETHDSICRSFP